MPIEPSPPNPSQAPVAGLGFLNNVLWSWLGIVVSLASAFILSPMIIRRLGDSNYGLWVVSSSLVEYYWLIDFGLRAALVRLAAHHNANHDVEKLNQVVATTAYYSSALIPVLVPLTFWAAPRLAVFLHVENPIFPHLVIIVGLGWSFTSFFSTFTSCLEGLQRFDVISQSTFISILLRAAGMLALLEWGYGVVEIAYLTVGAQILLHLINFFRLKRLFPALSLSPRHVRIPVFVEMIRYGAHSVVSSIGQRILNQSPPLMITYFLSESFSGYYANPKQLLEYTTEAVLRIGNVSNSRSSELMAQGRRSDLLKFAMRVNRLSLALFLPLSVFLAVYGKPFLLWWIKKPAFVEQAAGVLMVMIAGYTLGMAGQYSTQSILFGISRHQGVARNILIEALVSLAGMWWLIPHYGIVAAGAWNAMLLVVNRGVITPWLLTRELESSLGKYLFEVNRPLAAALVAWIGALLLKQVIPGTNFSQLISVGVLITAIYLPFLYLVIPAEDREGLQDKIRGLMKRFA